MENGPFAICQLVDIDNNSDFNWKTIRWGYDTLEQAANDRAAVAEEEKIPKADLTVIQIHDLLEQPAEASDG